MSCKVWDGLGVYAEVPIGMGNNFQEATRLPTVSHGYAAATCTSLPSYE
ncbi:hypothetical protein [Calycomorphotria hydatis]|nr:hypothetical protein [Calycomorphotria hydatis]